MLRHLLSGVVIVAASVSPVLATDLIIDDEEMVVVDDVGYDWTGFYVGAHVGYGAGIVEHRFGDVGDDPATFDDLEDFDIGGWLAGVHLGANVQQDSMVFGVEGLLDWAPLIGDDGGEGGDTNEFEGRFLGTGAARVGFAADTWFFYLSGGGAVMTANGNVTDPGEEETVGYTFFGGTVGAGVEVAVDENVSLRLDYRYYHFLPAVATYPVNVYDREFAPRFHTISAGVSVGF